MKTIKSWTGGSHPKPLHEISDDELTLILELLGQQVKEFFQYWKTSKSNDEMDAIRILFNRARYDAHATLNQQ